MVNKARPRSRAQTRAETRALAEKLAVEALTFIASDTERLGRFLAVTGIGPSDIRAAAREPLFLAGVLDHLANNETDLVVFARETGNPPADILVCRDELAGRRWERETP